MFLEFQTPAAQVDSIPWFGFVDYSPSTHQLRLCNYRLGIKGSVDSSE